MALSALPFRTDAVPFLVTLAVAACFWFPARFTRFRRLLLPALLFGTVVSLVAVWQHHVTSRYVFGFDVMTTHNALWNLVNGRGVHADPVGISYFAVHPLFILPLYLPFYLLFEHPYMLNLAHYGLALAAAALAYALARERLGSREAGLCCALVFLLLPATSGSILVECQPSFAGVPLLFAYFLFKERKKRSLAGLFAVLTALTWEPFLAAMILEGGLEMIRPGGDRRLGRIALFAGLAALSLYLLNRQPSVDLSASRHYAAVGGTPLAALEMIVRDPLGLARVVFHPSKIGLFVHLGLPLLFLPLLRPRLLFLCVPEWIIILLANPGDDMTKINCFYIQVSMVVGVYALITVLARFDPESGRAPRLAFVVLVHVALLQFAYHHTFLPRTLENLRALPENARRGLIETAPKGLVPEGSRVVVMERGALIRFPRRHLLYPDAFLSPVVERAWREGRLEHEYLVVDADRGASAFRGYGLVAENWEGLTILRRSPVD